MVSSLSLLSSLVICLGVCHGSDVAQLPPCQTAGLKYLRGDAITGSTSCLGPDNQPYPINSVGRVYSGQTRKGRSSKLVDPIETQKTLLKYYAAANYGQEVSHQRNSYRQNRNLMPDNFPDTESRMRPASESSSRYGGCSGPGGRLCKTRYNTTAPLYGVSLTSGQPVTIVQKFPDLLQQVIYEVCDSSECDVIQGECVQTYLPYLFLVIPLGPVTLTGQDYVLVENGCICRPKYATTTNSQESIIADTLPGF